MHVRRGVSLSQVRVEDHLLLIRDRSVDRVVVGARERPLSHREELQDLQTLAYAVLDSQQPVIKCFVCCYFTEYWLGLYFGVSRDWQWVRL